MLYIEQYLLSTLGSSCIIESMYQLAQLIVISDYSKFHLLCAVCIEPHTLHSI